jgi:predicted amidohydrolase YtcJ
MTKEYDRKGTFTRRGFVKATAAGAALSSAGLLLNQALARDGDRDDRDDRDHRGRHESNDCDGSRDIALVNGRILTMDAKNTVASAVAIRNGRFAEIGHADDLGRCSRTINLRGATVIPGLIDSHVHFIRDGLNPGHEVRIIETATTIAELLGMISVRAKSVPAGQFISCVGGWNFRGVTEQRLPTPAELSAAAPNNPLYLSETGGSNKAITNAAGVAWFAGKGVAVNADGSVVSAAAAFGALRNAEIAGDPALPNRATTTNVAVDFLTSLGMTMVHDVGGNGGPLGRDGTLFVDLKPYDQALALWRAKQLNMRIRTFYYSEIDPAFDIARARMDNNLVRMGDDIFRLNGVGERVTQVLENPGFINHCVYAAKNGWTVHQHSSSQVEIPIHVQAFQTANAAVPNGIAPLRWSLTHVNNITDAQVQAMIAMKTGVTVQGTQYTGTAGGTRFRTLLDTFGAAGLPIGGGSDATNVGAINPWLMMSFMSSFTNNAGVSLATGAYVNQACTRLEALRMYTMGSAYYSFDDHHLGSIEKGKLADLAVLSDDPLTVSEARFRKLSSVLTLQGGRIVSGKLA